MPRPAAQRPFSTARYLHPVARVQSPTARSLTLVRKAISKRLRWHTRADLAAEEFGIQGEMLPHGMATTMV